MQRQLSLDLKNWFWQQGRKPLIIRGARQVGKTWLVRYLAEQLKLQLVELNFERNPELKSFFVDNNPHNTVAQLETFLNIDIVPNQSLLFLDEIQAAPELFAKLRWFAEELPELAVIATGSLLEFMLQDYEFSVPVGRVQYLYLEPMSFEEFLCAMNLHKLVDFLVNYKLTDQIPISIHNNLQKLLREYIVVGGLPAIVANWLQQRETASKFNIKAIQQDILTAYREDFAKYAKRVPHERLAEVLKAIPSLLGKKFKYSAVNKNVNSAAVKNALNLLCKARVCSKVNACAANGIPLEADVKENIFKVIMLDIGLVAAATNVLPQSVIVEHFANEGGIMEQLVGQSLKAALPKYVESQLYYWMREESGSEAEIDYLIQHDTTIVPIEVKSGKTGTLRSLHRFMQLKNLTKAVRFHSDLPSVTNVNVQDHLGMTINYELLSLPVYLVEQVYRLLG